MALLQHCCWNILHLEPNLEPKAERASLIFQLYTEWMRISEENQLWNFSGSMTVRSIDNVTKTMTFHIKNLQKKPSRANILACCQDYNNIHLKLPDLVILEEIYLNANGGQRYRHMHKSATGYKDSVCWGSQAGDCRAHTLPWGFPLACLSRKVKDEEVVLHPCMVSLI